MARLKIVLAISTMLMLLFSSTAYAAEVTENPATTAGHHDNPCCR